jgi:hypothetical protein
MSCLCPTKIGALKGDLLSLPSLAVPMPALPKFLDDLSTMPGGSSPVVAMSDNIKLKLGALIAVKPPALGISPVVLGQLQGLLPTILHVKATLGVNLLAPNPGQKLAPIMAQANQALPALLPLGDLDSGPLMKLASLLMVLDALKMSLGINLLKPGVAVSLNLAPVLPVAQLAALAPVGTLFTTMGGLGINLADPACMAQLAAKLSVLAAIPIPKLSVDPATLAPILALLMATTTTKRLLGFDPIANPGKLALTLAPLAALGSVVLSSTFAEAALAATLIPVVLPLLKVPNLAALLPKLPAVPALPMPDLSAVSSVGTVMSSGLGSLSPCGPVCGMIGSFAPTGLAGKIGSLFG